MVSAIKPIPKPLLIDQAVYQVVTGKDSWGKEEVVETPLTSVLVQPKHAVIRGHQSESESHVLLLFFDAVNSSPTGHVFNLDGRVVYDGRVYRVVDITVAKALSGTPHHYEVELT